MLFSEISSFMDDAVHDRQVDAVESLSPLIDTDSPCRSAGICIHKPENVQLGTMKNHVREVTREVRRQGKGLCSRLLCADFVLLSVGLLRDQVDDERPQAHEATAHGIQAIWVHLAFLLQNPRRPDMRRFEHESKIVQMTGPQISATHKLATTHSQKSSFQARSKPNVLMQKAASSWPVIWNPFHKTRSNNSRARKACCGGSSASRMFSLSTRYLMKLYLKTMVMKVALETAVLAPTTMWRGTEDG